MLKTLQYCLLLVSFAAARAGVTRGRGACVTPALSGYERDQPSFCTYVFFLKGQEPTTKSQKFLHPNCEEEFEDRQIAHRNSKGELEFSYSTLR